MSSTVVRSLVLVCCLAGFSRPQSAGRTPLHTAAAQDDGDIMDVARLLLDKRADVNAVDVRSYLTWFVLRQYLSTGRWSLLVHGLSQANGMTPLHTAAVNFLADANVAELFLEWGADANAVGVRKMGRSAFPVLFCN